MAKLVCICPNDKNHGELAYHKNYPKSSFTCSKCKLLQYKSLFFRMLKCEQCDFTICSTCIRISPEVKKVSDTTIHDPTLYDVTFKTSKGNILKQPDKPMFKNCKYKKSLGNHKNTGQQYGDENILKRR